MKKMLLILALLAYVAISCDKPETLTGGDEPEVDTSADTCSIIIDNTSGWPTSAMVFQHPSSEVDFNASVNSMFRHLTITLKDGSLASPVGYNIITEYGSTFDTGRVNAIRNIFLLDSLKQDTYLVILWKSTKGAEWGPYYHDSTCAYLYRDITFNEKFTTETIYCDRDLYRMLRNAAPLSFTKF